MGHFETLQAEALGTHGVFSFKTARALGIRSPEIARWQRNNRIIKVGRGVYRLTNYPSEGNVSDMAAILAEVGDASFLYGESVLGFLELCPTRSYVVFVATCHRVRKALPSGVQLVFVKPDAKIFYHNGIPCQRLDDALLSSVGTIEAERLNQAIDEASNRGYFTEKEADKLRERIRHGQPTPQ